MSSLDLKEAKDKFIHTWGTLASQWGINRTMAQIHALLLLSSKALNADDIMEELKISRGNVNMNLRELMDWGLINKQLLAGERKEFFLAEKDIWKVARLIAKERRRREISPMLQAMEDIKTSLVNDNSPETEDFVKIVQDISQVAGFANETVDMLVKAEENWLLNSFFKALSNKA